MSSKLSNDKFIAAFLDVKDVSMNEEVDDPDNQNRGGIVFTIKDELTYID